MPLLTGCSVFPYVSLWSGCPCGVTARLLLIVFKVVLVCLSHLILHFDSTPWVSSTVFSSDVPLLYQHCDSLTLMSPHVVVFSAAMTKLCVAPERCPWKIWQGKDMISQCWAQMFFQWAHVGCIQKSRLPPLIPFWYVHKMRLKVSQSSGTRIPNKIVCLCRQPVKTD